MTEIRHWVVLPVDPEAEPFIAWGSVEADDYRRQPAVYRVEEYVRADAYQGAVRRIAELEAELASYRRTAARERSADRLSDAY